MQTQHGPQNGYSRTLFPPIEPYDSGMLDVGDDHHVYWEVCGNPKGKPALFLHGGPGGGCSADHRRLFDPRKYRIILFDQRGSGRSTPYASTENNTTWHLVADIEKLRIMFDIEEWLVLGGSWGSTLALAYAETYPERVSELVLRGIFTARRFEIHWLFQEGASLLFPDKWEKFISLIPVSEREDLLTAYSRRLNSEDQTVREEAAKAWALWEGETSTLLPNESTAAHYGDARFALAFAGIEIHYFMNDAFLDEGQLFRDIDHLRGIPGTIIQGRYDVVTPARTAWELYRLWPESEIVIVDDAGHVFNEPGIIHHTVTATDLYASDG
ncbi:MAG: proline iminopeptidase [Rhizobiaceae bacterium MnEN-MB40S]|nr:MAG: proline iminopeptidase [Rhizobiaceae bacterium MnEN-MB40S]